MKSGRDGTERGKRVSPEQIRFRVHHILCTALYEGEGYDGAFCNNMTKVTEMLKTYPDERRLLLVTGPDAICAGCPNHTEQEECVLDQNHVTEKDRLLLETLGLEENRIYSYRQLCARADEKITAAAFSKSCSGCLWYRRGLCSYEKLKENLR